MIFANLQGDAPLKKLIISEGFIIPTINKRKIIIAMIRIIVSGSSVPFI